MIAVFIFSMVVAGFAVIYGTAFKQGFRTIQGADLRAMGSVASRAIQKEVSQATMLGAPLSGTGTSSNNLRGYTNITRISAGTYQSPLVAGTPVGWFHFCIQTGDVGVCDADAGIGRACLVGYIGGTGFPGPAVNAVNCGDAVGGGSTVMVVANWVLATGPPGGVANYFSRSVADVAERNQVRVAFRLFRPATQNTMLISHDVDKTITLHFSEDNPS